ncbi:MAG TPA: hypothetical protein VGL53_13575, partial [Bryobacteraceae bacterium]|jgi:hypothetical protein
LSGQSLPVRTIFDNRSAAEIQVPSENGSSQYLYQLRSQKEGGPVYPLSEEIAFDRRSPDRVPSPPPETQPLDAGGKVERIEDIADFANEGFEPGKYWLTVEYDAGGLVSPKSAVTILPMNVESFSSFTSDGHLSSVLAHRRLDGRVMILHRESYVRDPREGVFYVLNLLPPGASGPVSVATAIDVIPAGNGRWFAWTQAGSITASNAWGDKIMLTTEPVPASGTLLSPGFQIAVGTALFGVVSSTGHLETFLATASGLKKHWEADLGGVPPASAKILWNAQSDASVVVAWEDPNGRIVRRSFGPDGHPTDAAPQPITPGRSMAWGLPATGAPTIWAVVGDGTNFALARLGIAGERSLTRLPAFPPSAGGNIGPDWDFHDAKPGASGCVASIAGQKLYSTRIDVPSWKESKEPVIREKVRGMHVVTLNGRGMWAEWIEPGYGIRRAKLP